MDGFDFSKHSGIIAHFNQMCVKAGIFDKEISKLLRIALSSREKADYDDFAEVTYEMAEKVISAVEYYLESKQEQGHKS